MLVRAAFQRLNRLTKHCARSHTRLLQVTLTSSFPSHDKEYMIVSEVVWVIRTVPCVVDPRPVVVSVNVRWLLTMSNVATNDGVIVVGMSESVYS